jgi:elongation factor 1-alpha
MAYDEKRFNEVKSEVVKRLKKVIPASNINLFTFVPISAWLGENIMQKSDKMPWYQGPTLIEAIDSL